MKNKLSYARRLGALALIALSGAGARAEDIDIYQGTASSGAANLLIILDNSAAASASSTFPCSALPVNDPNKNLGFEQCGLYAAVRSLGTNTSLNGNLNLGLMYLPTGGTDGGTFVLPDPAPPPSSLQLMDGDGNGDGNGVDKMLKRIAALSLAKDKSNNNQVAQTMQEAWAFYQAKTGLSGTTYPGLASPEACTRNFVVYITLATNNQKPQDAGDRAGIALQSAAKLSGLPAQVALPGWTGASGKYKSDYSDEWAGFMYKNAGITTYSIILSDGSNPDYEQLMASMAQQGGTTATVVKIGDVDALVKALERIFRDVQATNSVFAAPVLPVSANTQGTYVNQIYMGMFRPDKTGSPRWMGNLKQYQFGVDMTDIDAPQLFLADASWGDYPVGQDANRALNAAGTGFLSTTAISFWTGKNTDNVPDAWEGFWRNVYVQQEATHGYDWEDGQVVEKGGVSQQIRLKQLTDAYALDASSSTYASTRNVFTCVGSACSATAALRNMPLKTSNTSLNDDVTGIKAGVTTLSLLARKLIDWVRGADTSAAGDTDAGPEAGSPPSGTGSKDPKITVRGSVHGDVLHSRPVVIDYGGSTGVVVFYGANDGLFRAVNGNQPPKSTKPASDSGGAYGRQPMGNCVLTGNATCAIPVTAGGVTTQVPPGGELWGFVPEEFLPRLQQLYRNSPALTLGSTNGSGKPYFFDGAPGVYYNRSTGKAYLFLSARRGGRLLYALDVSDPANPTFMWKHSNIDSGFEELGQTWSQPKVAMIKGYDDPVLIFGAGYDTSEDAEPPKADAMGRGIFVLNAVTGEQLWRAVPAADGASASCADNVCKVPGMNYAIPADITLVDRDFDGLIDRLYAADTGGNIWRVDLLRNATGARSNWGVTQLAALGGSNLDATKRKFFYPPDVVLTKTYDVVVNVTGDREHPLLSNGANAIVNRFYMIKDGKPGNNASDWTTVVDDTASNADNKPASLFRVTPDTPYDNSGSGFFVTLGNAGEKGVNAPTTVGGKVYFGTNQPLDTSSTSCKANLGDARSYAVNFLKGTTDVTKLDGGGLVPSPVFGIVTVKVDGADRQLPFLIGGGGGKGADGKSGLGAQKPVILVNPVRKRTYWYRETDR